jgi:quercetin dioxygenase-like cupin family protein
VAGLVAAGLFGVPLLAVAQAPKKAAQHFSIAGQRPTFHEDDIERIEVVVSGADSEGRLSLVESIWLPTFSVSPHYHKAHAETFYIVSGKVEWTIGGETRVMSAGDAVHIPPNTVHSVRVLERMHSLMIYQNGGYEENVAVAASFTPEQRKDPKIQALLDRIGDFNRVSGPSPAPPPAAAGMPAKGVPVFSHRGKRGTFEERGVEAVELVLTGTQTEGRISIIESNWLPGFSVPAHYHKTHAETFYVLAGEVEWTIGGETRIVKGGDAVHIPPNTVHSVKVVGDEKMHSLMLSDPGGYEENAAETNAFTEEQRKDPKVQERLRRLGDFHLPGQK